MSYPESMFSLSISILFWPLFNSANAAPIPLTVVEATEPTAKARLGGEQFYLDGLENDTFQLRVDGQKESWNFTEIETRFLECDVELTYGQNGLFEIWVMDSRRSRCLTGPARQVQVRIEGKLLDSTLVLKGPTKPGTEDQRLDSGDRLLY